jgi:hypothetical protein
MEITVRDAVTVIHGMFFGALLLLALSGAAWSLYANSAPTSHWTLTSAQNRFLSCYLVFVALLAWIAVLLGAYVVYPWYRAHPPAGIADLGGYPQRLLMSNPATAGWHDVGMEWKEHVAWFAPISLTVVAYLFLRYGRYLHALPSLRRAVYALIALAFLSAAVAGFFGAMLNKYAPVRGGSTIELMHGDAHGE